MASNQGMFYPTQKTWMSILNNAALRKPSLSEAIKVGTKEGLVDLGNAVTSGFKIGTSVLIIGGVLIAAWKLGLFKYVKK